MASYKNLWRSDHLDVCVLILASLLYPLSACATSFDCAKAFSTVEKLICSNDELSRLDSELAVSYKQALAASRNIRETKTSEKEWLRVARGICSDVTCLKEAYQKRIRDLKSTDLIGEYYLFDKPDSPLFCKTFTNNLNEFRNIDFDTCDATLSPKYPQFSRPHWEEIPLDLELAKKIIIGDLKGKTKKAIDEPWEAWLKDTESARAAGEVKMWRTRLDLLGNGELETLVRIDHGVRQDACEPPLKRPFCSYIDGKTYMLAAPNPMYIRSFNLNSFLRGGDIIYDSISKHYYLLNWSRCPAGGAGMPVPIIGATASVDVSTYYEYGIAIDCSIDWLPTGRYGKPLRQDTH